MPMADEIALLKRIKALNDNAIRAVHEFTVDENLFALALKYGENTWKERSC